MCIARSTLGDAIAVAVYQDEYVGLYSDIEIITLRLSGVAALCRARQTKRTAARLRGQRNDKMWRKTPSGKLSRPATWHDDLHVSDKHVVSTAIQRMAPAFTTSMYIDGSPQDVTTRHERVLTKGVNVHYILDKTWFACSCSLAEEKNRTP